METFSEFAIHFFFFFFLLIGTVHAASFSEDKLADPVVVCHRTWFCFQFCNLAPFSKYCCKPTSSFQISFPGSFPLSVAQKIKLISLSWYVISVSVYWSNQFSFKIIILQKSMHAKFYSQGSNLRKKVSHYSSKIVVHIFCLQSSCTVSYCNLYYICLC